MFNWLRQKGFKGVCFWVSFELTSSSLTHSLSSLGSTGRNLGCWFGRTVSQLCRDWWQFSVLSDLIVGLLKNLMDVQEAFLALHIIRMGDDRCIVSWYFIVFTLWWVVFQHFEAQILR